MQYALIQVLPDVPPGRVCAGIDWASTDHVACVVDMAGRAVDRFSAAHDKAGIAAMIARLRRAGAGEVAIERSDGPLVAALLAAGLTVVVITSRQVKNLRSRYGAAGGKDDRFDSYVLADTLRTDRARLRPLVPDTPATAALRSAVRARKDLVAHRVAAANQLRAHLAAAFPAAVGLFSELDGPLSLAFLARFGSQDAAAGLDEGAMAGWLSTLPARGNPAPPAVLCARLRAAPAGPAGSDGAAQAGVTTALTATLTALSAQIKTLEIQIAAQLGAHPSAHIFASLPPRRHAARGPAAGAAVPQRRGDRDAGPGRHGDRAGRVAADDHHACPGGEGQPVPAAPAQRAGDRPVGHAAGTVDAGEPVHHVPAKHRRAAQCRRDRERQGPGRGRRAGGTGRGRRGDDRGRSAGRSRLPPAAGGGTGQRRGEAAGISRAVRVFKRCSEKGDVPPLWVSEGELEHGNR
jgi:transposase